MLTDVTEVRSEWARQLLLVLDTSEVSNGFQSIVQALRLAADLLKNGKLTSIHMNILEVDRRKPGVTTRDWRSLHSQLRSRLVPFQVLYNSKQSDPELKELGFAASVARQLLGRNPTIQICREAGNRATLIPLPDFFLFQIQTGYEVQEPKQTKKAA